jgi:hypothetical protein
MNTYKNKKIEALKLRKIGLSFDNIAKKLEISKSTIYSWTKNIILTSQQIKLLRNRPNLLYDGGKKKGSLSKKRILMGEKLWKEYQKEKTNEINRRWRTKNWKKYKNRHSEIKKNAVKYKGGKCIQCKYDKDLKKLIFHHKNSLEKEFTISNCNYKWERIKKELDKCILLCDSCHSKLHWIERKQNMVV